MTEELDEIYRRASALDPSRPSESVRRKVLEHAAALAARPRPTANRPRWRPAIFGTLAAAGFAGLLIVPRVFNPHPAAKSADTAAPAQLPPDADAPPVAGTPAIAGAPPAAGGAPPFADAPSMNSAPAPSPFPPSRAARSRAITPSDQQITVPHEDAQSLAEAKSRPADASPMGASRLDAAAQRGAAAQPGVAAEQGVAAEPGVAAQPGLLGGQTAAIARPASPPADPSAALRRAAETGDVQALRVILDAEVRIDGPDARGRTALMLAASRGHAESVDVLLTHGADPNAADVDGTTPLKAALAADQPAIIAALRRAGAR
jgi:hypothetical protein